MPVKVPMPYQPYIKSDQLIRIVLAPLEESSISPVSIPTTEPSTGQFYRTIVSADLPTITPTDAYRANVAYVCMAGQNTSASAVTLNWKMLKGGVLVSSGNVSVSAANFWRLIACWLGVVADDVIEIRLWGSASGLNYDFVAYHIHPSRIYTSQSLNNPCTTVFEGLVSAPVFTTANAPSGTVTTTGFSPQHLDWSLPAIGGVTGYDMLIPRATAGLFRVAYGDTSAPINTGSTATGTSRGGLTQLRSWIPTVIKLVIWKMW